MYISGFLIYNILGWFVERVRDAGRLASASPMLFRPSHPGGCHVGPFLSGPESETMGRLALLQETNRGKEIVLWESEL